MADFRIDVGFFHHPKTKRLKRALGLEGVFALQQLWAYAAANKHDAEKVYSVEDVELAVDWDGEPGSLVSVLAAVGYVDAVPGGYAIHEWETHNGYAATAAKRSEAGRNAAAARWHNKRLCGGNADACEPQSDCNTAAMLTHANGNAPFPLPSPLPSPSPKKKKESILHAPPTAGDGKIYITKRKRKLAGQKLAWFNRFWPAFAYPKGKAEAADAWLDIPDMTAELVDRIVLAATAEAAARVEAMAQGKTPKMAQGWLSGRRWEDEAVSTPASTGIDLAAVEAALEERKRRNMQ